MTMATPENVQLITVDRIAKTLIRYPRLKELHRAFDELIELSEMGEPHCMSLEGEPGTGKTTIAKGYADAHPRLRRPEGFIIPVLYMLTPSKPTIKGLTAAMLHELGDPIADRGTRWVMDNRLEHFLKECQVRLVILDEFHGLYDAETDRILARVSDWLKILIKRTGVPFVVVGRKGKVNSILYANLELSRLFGRREVLEPLAWNAAQADSAHGLGRFVALTEAALGVPLTKELPTVDMLSRLHYATEGQVGLLMNLLRDAALRALKRNQAEISLPLLSLGFRQGLSQHFPRKIDPFSQFGNTPFAPPPPEPTAATDGAARKKGRRDLPVASVGQILTAS